MAKTQRTKWTPEMESRLAELRARNFTVLEIAQDMGLDFDVVQRKIWNKKYHYKDQTGAKPEPKESKTVPAEDVVNHPAHYTAGGIECIDAIRSAVSGLTGFEAYCSGTIMKYVWRWKLKNGVEDLKKAEVYLHWLIEEAERNG